MAEARTKVIERLRAREVAKPPAPVSPRMSLVQRSWLIHGLTQPGGKLSLFDKFGRRGEDLRHRRQFGGINVVANALQLLVKVHKTAQIICVGHDGCLC